jgi:hypothetical protein
MEENEIVELFEKTSKDLNKAIWAKERWKFRDENLEKKYEVLLEKWKIDLSELRDSQPIKLSIYLSQLITGHFITKIGNDWPKMKMESSGEWSTETHIKFIQNTYEFVYHYFGIIGILNAKDNDLENNVYENWHLIKKAKGVGSKSNFWLFDGVKLSGTKWILKTLNNSGLFQIDLKLLSTIRNGNSHNGIIESNDKIYIIEDHKYVDVVAEVKILSQQLLSYLDVAVHFIMHCLFSEGYYIYPVTGILLRDKISGFPKSVSNPSDIFKSENVNLSKRPATAALMKGYKSMREELYKFSYKFVKGKNYDSENTEFDIEIEQFNLMLHVFIGVFLGDKYLYSYIFNECNVHVLLKKMKFRIDVKQLFELNNKLYIDSKNMSYEVTTSFLKHILDCNISDEEMKLRLSEKSENELDQRMDEIVAREVTLLIREGKTGLSITYMSLYVRAFYPLNLIPKGIDKVIVPSDGKDFLFLEK